MKPSHTISISIIALFHISFVCGADDDRGFHSIAEYLAVDPTMMSHLGVESIDDVFDTKDAAKRLGSEKRVRLVRKTHETGNAFAGYYDLERKGALRDRLGKTHPAVEIEEAAFRPVLRLAADFANYGDETICSFDPGVAVVIGDDEPDFVLVCCFACHDIHVVRRPTAEHPLPQVVRVGMSPELERAIFALTRAAYPKDKELQSFQLAERRRSKTPVTKDVPSSPPDPFAAEKSGTKKKS